ncbi:C-C motif chemokine 20-like [Pseudoliparis swirei]|uniref:C-C motif chemokine 20-like n=1 Tax=Pseudoliparis swirei TaxID=2059687 RepID=UPI0024BDBD3B|nr:C-C motif chemokine 20-like [Pseudoliparis swirei]
MRKLILCVSVMLVLLVALSNSSRICCRQYQHKPIHVKFLKHYTIQKLTDYCNIKAIIFKTLKNRPLCGDPDKKWVQKAMESVPE